MAELKTTAEWRQIAKQQHYRDEQVPHHNLVSAIEDIDTLLAENQKMREALQWYADEKNWKERNEGNDYYGWFFTSNCREDEGQRAREALKTVNAERTDSDAQT